MLREPSDNSKMNSRESHLTLAADAAAMHAPTDSLLLLESDGPDMVQCLVHC